MMLGAVDPTVLSALDRVRAAVLTRTDLAAALAAQHEAAAFAVLLAEAAASLGAGLSPEAIRSVLALPPIGPQALPLPVRSCADGAPRGWRPAAVDLMTGLVEWVRLGEARADGGFYYNEVHQAQQRPFNRLFRFTSPLGELMGAPPPDALLPAGIVFHMSHCGSTLVSRMLAAADAHLSLGEPQPFNAALQLCAAGGLDDDVQARLLRGMAAALGRPRCAETRYFLKLDTWHIALLPVIRRAFPDARWIFLYRDPLEVLEGQLRGQGLDAARAQLHLFGIDWGEISPDASMIAAVLAAICERALAAAGAEPDRGLLVSYAELPEAVATRIAPHFGVQPSAGDIAAMAEAARRDAKASGHAFVADSDAKRASASPQTRAAAEGRLAETWARLEAARGARRAP